MAAKKVAIIGGGPCGLTTLKECLAQGLDAALFEARDGIGGQWRYEEPDPETGHAVSSMYEGVTLNSFRDGTSFSDFPIDPAHYPDYFCHRKMLEYIEHYADHFGLRKFIRLQTRVVSCNQLADGRWTVLHHETGEDEVTSVYDAIFACTGHSSRPWIPEFEGLNSFKGEVLHSHIYRRAARFEGKKVALIGFASSAVDLACELVPVAKEVHMVTRRGGWIWPRFLFGQPTESYASRISESIVPARFAEWCEKQLLVFAVGEVPEEIKPDHKLSQANITVHSNLLEFIKVGKIKAHRASVKSFTEHSLNLTNNTELDVDAVIICTGYNMEAPYLAKETYHVENNPILKSHNSIDLYKLVVPPQFTNLFFIGYIEFRGPLLPVAEIQARWASSIVTGKVKLPPVDKMNQWVKEFQEELVRTMVVSDRHTVTVRFLPYCDSLLADLDANPTFARLARGLFTWHPLRAFSVLKAVYFGKRTPAQFRLFGHGRKPEIATATLLRLAGDNKEIDAVEKELVILDGDKAAGSKAN
ncbi:dimethylaniline monooxygenase [Paracoccidioides lutzii Pb01]|uniref:Flavin-containing monooxygenase 1 n=1 Tax=Paracoccidioides lutzii (strain ATCC MYA-826 / Pb01) TaxID=502779 RepID=C1GPZ2_PARBA|nr:dimethylaniline monooxygenase [Paracoccidioides lutzii Pb01]EEH36264.1 dimethylaniline monooxygenase [Paracoccidioides lutzii Pb01]